MNKGMHIYIYRYVCSYLIDVYISCMLICINVHRCIDMNKGMHIYRYMCSYVIDVYIMHGC